MTSRVDAALFAAGLASSRTHARRIVEEGRALINGAPAQRPSTPVEPEDRLEVTGVPSGGEYPSRAALKLAGALEALPTVSEALRGGRVVDIGASTGGFTDVCLRSGAAHVVAVDVGHGQLVDRLAADPRVTNLEGVDARALTVEQVGRIDVVISDVSFISLTHIVPVIGNLTEPGAQALAMVKPQFEVGRRRLPKSGVVTNPKLWREAIAGVVASAAEAGLECRAIEPSEVAGQDGNREFFVHAVRVGATPAVLAPEYAMIDDAVSRAREGNRRAGAARSVSDE